MNIASAHGAQAPGMIIRISFIGNTYVQRVVQQCQRTISALVLNHGGESRAKGRDQ